MEYPDKLFDKKPGEETSNYSLFDEAGNEFSDVEYFEFMEGLYAILETHVLEPDRESPKVYELDETTGEYLRVQDTKLARRVFGMYFATLNEVDRTDGPVWYYQPSYISMQDQMMMNSTYMTAEPGSDNQPVQPDQGIKPVQPDKFCRNCGAKRAAGAKFCTECGQGFPET